MIQRLIISAIVMLPVAVSAQQEQIMSLQQCFDTAMANNYGIKAAEKNVERQKAMQGTAWDIDKTELSLSQDPTSGGSPDNALVLSQQIDFPTTYIAKGKLLKAETRAERAKAELYKLQLKGDIAALYWQMVYQQELIAIMQHQDSVIANFCTIAAKRYEAGETRQLEKLSAERKLMDNRQSLSMAQTEMKTLQQRMMALINSDCIVVPTEKCLSEIKFDGGNFNFMQTKEGQYAQSQVDVADKAVTVAKSGYAPSLSVSLKNQLVISSWDPYNQNRARFSGGNFMGFEVGVGIPLFFGSTKAKVKAAKREREAAELEMRQNEVQRQQEHAELLGRVGEARKRVGYYNGDGSKRMENMEDLARIEYENGEITYLEYATVLDESIDNSLKRASALNDYNQALISLLRVTGYVGELK